MKGLIDVVFILDKSGSMFELKEDAVGGYNNLIEQTKKLDGSIRVTTVLFNTEMEVLSDRTPIPKVLPLTIEEYSPKGGTALLDAVGKTVDRFDDYYEEAKEEEIPEKVLFYITTDGMENSSEEYTYKMISKMIKQHEKQGWSFDFLASGIDEVRVGASLGIRRDRIYKCEASSRGQRVMYDRMLSSIEEYVAKK